MLKISKSRKQAARRVTFALPSNHPAGTVSVVGTFNDWQPGKHVLKRRSNGTMSASIELAEGCEIRFRFLGENGWWFDEPEADFVTHEGSVLVA